MKTKTKKTNATISKELLMSDILSLDLPLFLLVELSSTFDTLNEYKIANIEYHKEEFLNFLTLLQQEYINHIKHFSETTEVVASLMPEHTGLLTQYMLDHHLYPDCNAQQVCSIKCLFSVRCLLMIKEYINKKTQRSLFPLSTG